MFVLEQPALGLLPAAVDRLQQFAQRGVGVQGEWLRRAHLGHPRLHVAACDPDEMRP
ncbi:MAG: hypothetical protein ACLP01_33065 [Solirubrobacteraceae bacterium]